MFVIERHAVDETGMATAQGGRTNDEAA